MGELGFEERVYLEVARQQNPGEDFTLLDIGANLGIYTRLFLSMFPNGKAFCYEPIPEIFNKLSTTFAADPRVTCKNFGIYNKKISNHKFYYVTNLKGMTVDDSGMSSIHYRKDQFPRFEYKEIAVNLITLNSLIDKIPKVDFIKIDTEGSEYMVLEGGIRFINAKKPKYIQWEYGGCFQDSQTTGKQVVELLNKLHYVVMDGYSKVITPENFNEDYNLQNYLAVRYVRRA